MTPTPNPSSNRPIYHQRKSEENGTNVNKYSFNKIHTKNVSTYRAQHVERETECCTPQHVVPFRPNYLQKHCTFSFQAKMFRDN